MNNVAHCLELGLEVYQSYSTSDCALFSEPPLVLSEMVTWVLVTPDFNFVLTS